VANHEELHRYLIAIGAPILTGYLNPDDQPVAGHDRPLDGFRTLWRREQHSIEHFCPKKVIQTRKASPPPAPKPASKGRSNPVPQVTETVLYRAQVTITQVGEASPLGDFILQAMKRLQVYRIIALSEHNDVFASIVCDASIQWQLFENNTCSIAGPNRLVSFRFVLF
jgi:hypothetical protein